MMHQCITRRPFHNDEESVRFGPCWLQVAEHPDTSIWLIEGDDVAVEFEISCEASGIDRQVGLKPLGRFGHDSLCVELAEQVLGIGHDGFPLAVVSLLELVE